MLTMNYTYRIDPDATQQVELLEWMEACRGVYNYALRELKDWMASRQCPADRCSLEKEYIISANEPFPSSPRQQNNLPKAEKQFPHLGKVHSQVLQTTIRRLHDTWEAFQKRGHEFPRFKKFGQFKSFVFDPGLEQFLTASDGSFEESPQCFKSMQSKLKLLQRRAARKRKGSKNWEKAQLAVARAYHWIANRRQDFHLKRAHKLCDRAQTFFAEDLNTKGSTRGMLGKDGVDAAFGQCLSLAEWACWKGGIYFAKVDPNSPSQTCPNYFAVVSKGLEVREHHCPECGYRTDRDPPPASLRERAVAEMVLHRGLEQVSSQGLWRNESARQVGLSGVDDLDKWRTAQIPNREIGKPALYL
ncbi:RNA-guided endonuclease InsQ/TnpB family protein [Oxynema aestuarii]|nr:RNA-guided endonuclease TnpB family protein [Oxynema aestuarii]